jgi:hypothetical protein
MYKLIALIAVAATLGGCANTQASREEVLGQNDKKKQCYVVDSLTRHVRGTTPTAVGLGAVGALVPGLGVAAAVFAGANAASDLNGQQANCGMTANDALDAGLKMSHLERGQILVKGRSNDLEFLVQFASEVENCTIHKVSLRDFGSGKVFKREAKVCEKDGLITIG